MMKSMSEKAQVSLWRQTNRTRLMTGYPFTPSRGSTMLRLNRCSPTITTISLIVAILFGSGCATTSPSPSQTYNAELEYLKSLHQSGPVTEPQLVAFLMQQFMNANQQHAAIAFFESFLQKHGGQLSSEQTGLERLGRPARFLCQSGAPIESNRLGK
jgi:hypothetical protein